MGIQINGNTDTISALDGSWTSDSATHFTGKVSIGGTLTYEDVTNIDSVGLVTARDGVFIPDNKELKIGNTAGTPDLTIYHTSSDNNSYIKESGTGSLFVMASRFEVSNAAGTEALINAVQDTGVSLYDGTNTVRLATTNTGATVTGTLTATTLTGALSTTDACQTGDLTILNGNPDLRLKDSNHAGNNTEHMIAFQDSSGNNQMNIGSPFGEQHLRIKHGTTDLVKIQTDGKVGINKTDPATVLDIKSTKASDGLTVTKGSNVAAFLGHNGTGDEGLLHLKDGGTATIQIYAETGQVSFFNAGNVGIGEDTPTSLLHLKRSSTTAYSSSATNNDNTLMLINEGAAGHTSIQFQAVSGGTANTGQANINVFCEGNSAKNTAMAFGTRGSSGDPVERLRIDSGGRVGIKNLSPSSQYFNNLVVGDNNAGDWGITIRTNSSNKGVLAFSDSDAADANRYDGYIAYHHNGQSMRFHTAGANERLRINSSGQLIAGATLSGTEGGGAKLCIVGTGSAGITPSSIASSTLATFRMTGGLSHAAGISILAGSDGSSAINLGDRDNELIGRILYNHTSGNATDYMAFYVQGSEKLLIDSTGHVHVKGSDHAVRFYRDDGARYGAITYTGSNFNIMNPANDHTQITNSGGTAIIKFHHNGNILYGDHMNDRGAELQYEGSQHNMLGLHRNTADHGAASLTFSTSRGTSAGSNTIVQDDDYLGMIRFSGTDGSNLATGAFITAIVDGTPASDKMPSRIGLWTSDANSQSPTEHLRVSSNGNITIGSHPGMSATSHARLWIEHTGNNLSSEWDPGDNQGTRPHMTLAGINNHVRLDMGTMDTSPFAGYIQARFDNTPDTGATDSADGLEPLQIQPRGGQTYFNFGHSTAYPSNFSPGSAQGGIKIRAGTANSASVSEANTAIKIWPAAERAYQGGLMGDADQGSKYGGIAWLVMDGQSPGKSSWATYDGNQCWMGMSLHSTPGQELGNWQLRMNDSGNQNSVANKIALQASPQGWVTKPNQPMFLAHKNSGNLISGTGYVTFGDQIEEVGGDHYNNSNGKFTAPIGGYYYIWCSINHYKRLDMQIRINGNTDHTHRQIGQFNTSNQNGWWTSTVHRIFRMEKDEYVQVYVSNLTQNTDPGEWCTFGGYLIG